MDPSTLYHLTTSAYLTTQSVPLLLAPSTIVALLGKSASQPTDLETYLCRALALSLLTLSALSLLLTPLSGLKLPTSDEGGGKEATPYSQPTTIVTTTYHALSAFYLYTQITYGWIFGFGAGMAISTGLFCLGVWVLLFGGEVSRLSKSTGADKRTGNFPFVNETSAREKKKESKRKSVLASSKSR